MKITVSQLRRLIKETVTSMHEPSPEDLKHKTIHPLFGKGAAVEAINVSDLIVALYPGYWEMDFNERPKYEERTARIQSWCDAHGALYYAMDHENFSLDDAREEAVKKGLGWVVYEDLS